MSTPKHLRAELPPTSRLALVGKLTADEARWICPTCGVVEPKQLKYNQRWMRQSCACEDAAKRAATREVWRQQEMDTILKRTYRWLGEQWSDMPLTEKTFDTFLAVRQPEAFETVRLFATEMQGTLVLYGPYGTGKTHLLAALCNETRLRLVPSYFTTAPKLFRAIQECIQHNEGYTHLIRNASRVQLLVLDDVDKAKHSDFREEVYFEIMDERSKRTLPTAISTNRLSDLAAFVGGAACSRLSVGQIAVEMAGTDYRLEM